MGSKTIKCKIINTTDYGISVSSYGPDGHNSGGFHPYHGEFTKGPLPVNAGETVDIAFEAKKSSSVSTQGTTGFVAYNLNNGQRLIIMFSHPPGAGSKGSNDNCYFYALIQGPEGGTTYANNVTPLSTSTQNFYAVVTGYEQDNCDPQKPDPLNATVTLHSY